MLEETGAQRIMLSYVVNVTTKNPKIMCVTGKQCSVKEFVNLVLKELNMTGKWKGKGFSFICNRKKSIIETENIF